jgi:hypothetical protein
MKLHILLVLFAILMLSIFTYKETYEQCPPSTVRSENKREPYRYCLGVSTKQYNVKTGRCPGRGILPDNKKCWHLPVYMF